MKIRLFLLVLLCISGIYFLAYQSTDNQPDPKLFPAPKDPTTVFQGQEEDGGNINRKKLYFEKMHRAAPNTNWRKIDAQTKFTNYQKKLQSNAVVHYSDDDGITWQPSTGFGFNHDWEIRYRSMQKRMQTIQYTTW